MAFAQQKKDDKAAKPKPGTTRTVKRTVVNKDQQACMQEGGWWHQQLGICEIETIR
jgi:hypothetical protein